MLIFYSSVGDPMLLDSCSCLKALHDRFNAFLASAAIEAAFDATSSGDPAPYDELLKGLRVRKRSGPGELRLSEDRWLELSSSIEELQQFGDRLPVPQDHGHHHWYCSPLSLIIEADEWRASQ